MLGIFFFMLSFVSSYFNDFFFIDNYYMKIFFSHLINIYLANAHFDVLTWVGGEYLNRILHTDFFPILLNFDCTCFTNVLLFSLMMKVLDSFQRITYWLVCKFQSSHYAIHNDSRHPHVFENLGNEFLFIYKLFFEA